MSIRRKLRTRRSAFTLIEIMVATVVMVILVGLVVQMTSEVLKIWNRSSGKLSANAEARIAMDLLTQDLETAILGNEELQWFRVEGPIHPGGEYSNQTVSLKLFSPASDRPQEDSTGNEIAGDICGIGYRLAFREAYEGGPLTYALYRKVVDPQTTFNSLMGSTNQGALTGSLWSDASIIDEDNYLASNLVEFKVLVHADDGNDFPLNDVNPPYGDGDIDPGSVVVYGGTGSPSPHFTYADILLTVVSDQGIKILQALAEGQGGTGYVLNELGETPQEQVVAEHGKVFMRRVYFQAQAQ